jgi:magnesium chelatase family protein
LIPGVNVIPIKSLEELVHHLNGEQVVAPQATELDLADELPSALDFSHIKGQEHVKRALEVAAAGSHNVFMLWTKGRCVLPDGRARVTSQKAFRVANSPAYVA